MTPASTAAVANNAANASSNKRVLQTQPPMIQKGNGMVLRRLLHATALSGAATDSPFRGKRKRATASVTSAPNDKDTHLRSSSSTSKSTNNGSSAGDDTDDKEEPAEEKDSIMIIMHKKKEQRLQQMAIRRILALDRAIEKRVAKKTSKGILRRSSSHHHYRSKSSKDKIVEHRCGSTRHR